MDVLNNYEEVLRENLRLQKELGPEIRPLRGLAPNKRGSSTTLNLGDKKKSLVEARTPGQDAEMMTVECGLTALNPSIGNNSTDIVGTLEWGIGGANFQADFDFVNGLSFSVVANYLRVSAAYNGAMAPFPFGPPISFQANAAVGYGSTARRAGVARRTLDLGTILVGATAFFLIPPFATTLGITTDVNPFTGGSLAGGLIMTLLNNGLGSDATYVYTDQSNLANQLETSYAIPNSNAILALITNNTPQSVKTQIIFGLSF